MKKLRRDGEERKRNNQTRQHEGEGEEKDLNCMIEDRRLRSTNWKMVRNHAGKKKKWKSFTIRIKRRNQGF